MINACQKCLPTTARHLHQRDPLLPALCCSIFQTYKSEHSNRSAGLPRRDVSGRQTAIVWQACTASSVWCKTSPPARAHLNGCSRKPSGNHGTDLETGSIDTRARSIGGCHSSVFYRLWDKSWKLQTCRYAIGARDRNFIYKRNERKKKKHPNTMKGSGFTAGTGNNR